MPLTDALRAARLLAIDPVGLGGLCLRGRPGPAREACLAALQQALPATAPWRRAPLHVDDERLLGGLDVAASLAAGRPVQQAGLVAQAHGGVLLLPMAERWPAARAAQLVAAIEAGTVRPATAPVARAADDGQDADPADPTDEAGGRPGPARAGAAIVALDEGVEGEDAAPPRALLDRLALIVTLPDGPDPAASGRTDREARDPSMPGLAEGAPTGDELEALADRFDAADTARARAALPAVAFDAACVQALCVAAQALGIASLRAPWQAWCVARACAAAGGRGTVTQDDAEVAARLVLAPRARSLPAADKASESCDAAPATDPAEAPSPSTSPTPAPIDGQDGPAPDHDRLPSSTLDTSPPTTGDDREAPTDPTPDAPLAERLVEAATAALPPMLLASLADPASHGRARGGEGRKGSAVQGATHGRPMSPKRGRPGAAARLDVLATLRAAVPWQAMRQRERAHAHGGPGAGRLQPSAASHETAGAGARPSTDGSQGQRDRTRGRDAIVRNASAPPDHPAPRWQVRKDDFHVRRYAQPKPTTTVFVVDASGSQALHRLAEAKGAVELLLADCYVRRDRVALIAFRGTGAEVLLAPTRSLVRARRCLTALPGGGGTPLAAGLEAAWLMARRLRSHDGAQAKLVFLTDAQANVARDGLGGRAQATTDAMAMAARLAAEPCASVLIDTSPRPQPKAAALAAAMHARYVALPLAGARAVYAAVAAR